MKKRLSERQPLVLSELGIDAYALKFENDPHRLGSLVKARRDKGSSRLIGAECPFKLINSPAVR